jgi:putative ABC transport system permease protein
MATTFTEDLVARLRTMPGVRAAGYAQSLPMIRYNGVVALRTASEATNVVPPPPAPFGARGRPEFPNVRRVSRDFLTVMGVRLVAGRGFTERDDASQPRVMLINQALARSGLLGPNPIGLRVYASGAEPWEIVGIVDDVRQLGLELEADPQVFFDTRQSPTAAGAEYFAVRTDAADPASIASSVRAAVRELDPRATVDHVATMEEIVSSSISRRRLYAVLLGVFAGVAVLLAAIGIYGVMAYAVTQRTREIGIRIALGAARADVLGLMLRQSLTLTVVGITLGLGGAAALTRSLEGALFGLTPHDPTTFVAVAVLFGAIATVAAFVPARRATKVDPLIALRTE